MLALPNAAALTAPIFSRPRPDEWQEVRRHSDRTHPGPAAAMRNAECLVQIQMADIRADFARRREPDLRVHVRAVHVDLPAARMDQRANIDDGFLENAVRAGIGHHQRCELILVFISLRGQVGHVDVAVREARDGDHTHPRHHRARRIGPMRRSRNEADVTVPFASGLMVFSNHQQACVFALRAGVGFQRNARKAGDFREPILELRAQHPVTLSLLGGRKRMHLAELWPRHRQHLARGIQLHRAGAERNHRSRERQIFCLQAPDVAQHFRFGVMSVEDRVREEPARSGVTIMPVSHLAAFAKKCIGFVEEAHRAAGFDTVEQSVEVLLGFANKTGNERGKIDRKELREPADVRKVRRLVERDLQRSWADPPEVPTMSRRRCADRVRFASLGKPHKDRVEERERSGVETLLFQRLREQSREEMRACGNFPKPIRAVIDRVHRCHHREEHLRRADVARRFVAADVLLAGLERKSIRRVAMRVLGNADESARHQAFERVTCRHVCCVRSAKPKWHAEALRGSNGNVGAELARRSQQRERENIRRDNRQGAGRVGALDEGTVIANRSKRVRILQQHGEDMFPAKSKASSSPTITSIASASARVCTTAMVCGWQKLETKIAFASARFENPCAMCIASAAAVASSSSEAFAMSSPVRSMTICWKLISASIRPCEISA